MPAALPNKFVPKIDATQSTSYRVRSVQYGEGYQQRSPDGLNARAITWQLVFTGLQKADGDELEAFFDARAGWDAILWTPPDEVAPVNPALQSKWLVSEIRRTFISGMLLSEVTCTFKRLYE